MLGNVAVTAGAGERRTIGLPEDISKAPGLGIAHNPGVALLWITKRYRLFEVPPEAVREAGAQPGVLFALGDPVAIACYREGRAATRAEITAAIERGLPYLRETAMSQGPAAMAALLQQLRAFERLLEAHVGGDASARGPLASGEEERHGAIGVSCPQCVNYDSKPLPAAPMALEKSIHSWPLP